MIVIYLIRSMLAKIDGSNVLNFTGGILQFIFFSETVEMKLGRSKFVIFLLISSIFLFLSMKVMCLRWKEISINQLIRAFSSAFLIYIARFSTIPNHSYFYQGMSVSKVFDWNGFQIEYGQAAIFIILLQMINGDVFGLFGSLSGALMQDLMLWLSKN